VSLSATSYAWTIVPPAPTITAKPAGPTNLTGASFSFGDSLAGVTFVCALDASTFGACTSPKSYPGPLTEGSHTFQVKAVSAAQQSAPTAYTWRIDVSPPAISVSFPADGGSYNTAGWNAGCVGGAGLCGSAIDASGVAGASLSIQQLSTGKFWNGSSFSSTTETFNAAAATGGYSTSFVGRYPLAVPAAGSYRVHVRAADILGNTTTAAAQTSLTFTIDTAAPPAPAISGQPANPTTADSAIFTFTDSEPGVSFQCKLDGGSYASCSSARTYAGLALGSHTFSVQGKDAAGNLSAATSVTWTIKAGAPFTIKGSVTGLVPGVTTPVPLTISNPNNTPIFVSQLTLSVSTNANSGTCLAASYTVTAWTAPSSASELSVPANATNFAVPVADQPKIKLNNSTTANQDNCKGKSFTLTYSGSAHS
jgi:hypothetical protein